MEIESSTSLQEAPGATQKEGDTRENVASSQAPPNPALIEAFTWGFSEYGCDLSERSVVLFEELIALDVQVPLDFAEAQGAKAGLIDKLYMRRDALEHSAVVAILKWTKMFSHIVPEELVLHALQQPDARVAVSQVLADSLQDYPELLAQAKAIIAAAHADATAEGTVSAGSILNHSKGVPVPSLPKSHKMELAKAQKSPAYGNGTDITVAKILAGLAGDLDSAFNGKKSVRPTVSAVIAAGAGAAFYLGASVHAFYAEAQKQQIADAGEKIDFVTSGDGRVCVQCADAEDGNPWPVDSVPPIPLHGSCRCWYSAEGSA